MRVRLFLGIFAGVIGLGLLNTPARAQLFPLKGKIVSASVSVAADSTGTLLTLGAGQFILTQFCSSQPTLSGSAFGTIALGGTCTSFNPGFALVSDQEVVCDNTAFASPGFCSVSGILEPNAKK